MQPPYISSQTILHFPFTSVENFGNRSNHSFSNILNPEAEDQIFPGRFTYWPLYWKNWSYIGPISDDNKNVTGYFAISSRFLCLFLCPDLLHTDLLFDENVAIGWKYKAILISAKLVLCINSCRSYLF